MIFWFFGCGKRAGKGGFGGGMRLMELYGGFDCGGEHGFVRFCFG